MPGKIPVPATAGLRKILRSRGALAAWSEFMMRSRQYIHQSASWLSRLLERVAVLAGLSPKPFAVVLEHPVSAQPVLILSEPAAISLP